MAQGNRAPLPENSMELDRRALVFFLPFLVRTGLGYLFPSGAMALLPLAASLGLFAALAVKFPPRVGKLHLSSFAVGMVGTLIWVGVCALDLEGKWFPSLGLQSLLDMGSRQATARPENADALWWMSRALSLLLAAPVLEEFFFRGFIPRALGETDWWRPPYQPMKPFPLAVATLAFACLHGAEFFAAVFWFSLTSFWIARTRSLWDAVAVHAATNLTLVPAVLLLKSWGVDLTRLL